MPENIFLKTIETIKTLVETENNNNKKNYVKRRKIESETRNNKI